MHPKRAVPALLLAAGIAAGAASTPAQAAPAPHGLFDSLLSSLPLPTDATAAGQLLSGLGSAVTGLLSGTSGQPSAADVDAVIAKLTSVLQTGIPTDPQQLEDLQTVLAGLPALLNTPGLDQAGLSSLQDTVVGLLNGRPDAGSTTTPTLPTSPTGTGATPASLAGSLGALFGMTKSPSQPAATTTKPTAGATPAAGGGSTAAARNTRFRAKVTRVRVARGARTVKATLSCATSAPGCVTGVWAKASGRRTPVKMVGLSPGEVRTVTIRLPAGVAKRAVAKHSKITVNASTVGSSLGASQRSARPKRA